MADGVGGGVSGATTTKSPQWACSVGGEGALHDFQVAWKRGHKDKIIKKHTTKTKMDKTKCFTTVPVGNILCEGRAREGQQL